MKEGKKESIQEGTKETRNEGNKFQLRSYN
jgi:hypothetical protein